MNIPDWGWDSAHPRKKRNGESSNGIKLPGMASSIALTRNSAKYGKPTSNAGFRTMNESDITKEDQQAQNRIFIARKSASNAIGQLKKKYEKRL